MTPEKSHDAHVASVVAALPNIAIVSPDRHVQKLMETMRLLSQQCSYCHENYPYPVELHHTEDECGEVQKLWIPTVNGADNAVWRVPGHYIEQESNGDVILNDRFAISASEVEAVGRALLAAARAAGGQA